MSDSFTLCPFSRIRPCLNCSDVFSVSIKIRPMFRTICLHIRKGPVYCSVFTDLIVYFSPFLIFFCKSKLQLRMRKKDHFPSQC